MNNTKIIVEVDTGASDTLIKSVIKELHECHPGIVRMKNIARSYLLWPYIDSDIESVVRECTTCHHKIKSPSEAPLHP